jgi:hypothetical protein
MIRTNPSFQPPSLDLEKGTINLTQKKQSRPISITALSSLTALLVFTNLFTILGLILFLQNFLNSPIPDEHRNSNLGSQAERKKSTNWQSELWKEEEEDKRCCSKNDFIIAANRRGGTILGS